MGALVELMLSSIARVVLIFVALVWCAASVGPAVAMTSPRSAGSAPAGGVVLGDPFHRIAAAGSSVRFWTSGDYVLLQNSSQAGAPQGWSVINDETGTTTSLDLRCNPVGLGPPWVLTTCSLATSPSGPGDVELYSLTDGTQHTVTLRPGMPYCSSPPYDPEVGCSADAIGADWIEWVASSYHHLPTSVYFQSLQTGELRRDPTNATTFADLNSPALARRTCPGVRLMPNPDPTGTGWGSLTVDGQFALAVTANNSLVLERCGTRMRRVLANGDTAVSNAFASSANAVVWQAVTGRLNGLFLPSLQPFTIPLAPAIRLVGSLGLTSRALYVTGYVSGAAWRSARPTALPLNTSRPTLSRSGSVLRCRRGSWRDANRFSYAWRVNGRAKTDTKPSLVLVLDKGPRRRDVSCSVTASNAIGTTTASSDRLHVRQTATAR